MLLLALWCCCPSSVYRDHYVSAKADERETRRDHKRRQTSLSDPLIIADSFINMAFTRSMKTEEDRQAHTHTYARTQVWFIRKRGRSWPWEQYVWQNNLNLFSFASWLQFFGTLTSSENTLSNFLIVRITSYKTHILKAASYHAPPLLLLLHSFFLFCLQKQQFFSHPLFDPFHTSPPLFYLLLFSPSFHWQAAWTLAVVGRLSSSFEWEVKMQM